MDSNRLVNTNPSFSFLIPFRNRNIERVKNCLKSISAQTLKEYEVIFIDYGSDEKISNEVEGVVRSFGFQYIFTDTRGMFWNQNHALNTGLILSKGSFIIRLDVDLIISPHILAHISELLKANPYIHSKCYYLPANFNDYGSLITSVPVNLKVANDSALGLFMVVSKEKLMQVNGFDEYYVLWGFDDLDINKKLIRSGLKNVWVDLKEYPVYHQWHEQIHAELPTGFYEVKKKYMDSASLHENQNKAIGKQYSLITRPALKAALGDDNTNLISYRPSYPSENFIPDLLNTFLNLMPGKGLIIRFEFDTISKSDTTGKAENLMNWINSILEKISLSYRMVDLERYQTGFLTPKQVYEGLFYLVFNLRNIFADYYFNNDGKKITCILIR